MWDKRNFDNLALCKVIFFGVFMDYVVVDLEWNNAFDYKTKKGINEIIEIGAVRLNHNLQVVDTFKQLIKPKLSKKLSTRFVDLTGITREEISEYGIPFDRAIADFTRWSAGDDVLFMSWSNSDLYVLVSNYRRFFGTTSVSFIKKYMDVQKYCQNEMKITGKDQVSLAHCAEMLNISIDDLCLHRALEDCYLEAECFKSVYNKNTIADQVSFCDEDFFARLAYKPYLLTVPVSSYYNLYKDEFLCPVCNDRMSRLSDAQVVNSAFKFVCGCKKCNKKFWMFVRARKTYDGVTLSKRAVMMNKSRAKKY